MSLKLLVSNILNTEITFEFSKSSGPGGQNVNKRSTKAALIFNIGGSVFLDSLQKDIIVDKFRSRINKEGDLRVVSQSERTQEENIRKAKIRFEYMLLKALTPRKTRKKSGIPKKEKEKRIATKKKVSEKKKLRGKVRDFD